MRIALFSPPFLALVFGGCAAAQHTTVARTTSMHVIPMRIDTDDLDDNNPYIAKGSQDARKVGDWVTTHFAAGTKTSVTTQQRVLARDGGASVVEVLIKDGARSQTFRLRTAAGAAGEQVLDVTRVESGIEHASSLAAYEAAMQKTVPNVERNDGVIDSEPATIEVAGRKIEAVRTTYKVMYNGKPATMSVLHSDAFAWGDLGGDIVSMEGKVLYSTHITDTGNDTPAVADR